MPALSLCPAKPQSYSTDASPNLLGGEAADVVSKETLAREEHNLVCTAGRKPRLLLNAQCNAPRVALCALAPDVAQVRHKSAAQIRGQ